MQLELPLLVLTACSICSVAKLTRALLDVLLAKKPDPGCPGTNTLAFEGSQSVSVLNPPMFCAYFQRFLITKEITPACFWFYFLFLVNFRATFRLKLNLQFD